MNNFAALKSIRQTLKHKYASKIIDGNDISASIRKKIEHKINDLNEVQHAKIHDKPLLGYILVGSKPESELYVRLKKAACEKIGIQHKGIVLPETVTEKTIIEEVNKLQDDPTVSGILVQLPLPPHINAQRVLNFISPLKDVDGLHPFNIGSLAMKNYTPHFISCTPLACVELILRQL